MGLNTWYLVGKGKKIVYTPKPKKFVGDMSSEEAMAAEVEIPQLFFVSPVSVTGLKQDSACQPHVDLRLRGRRLGLRAKGSRNVNPGSLWAASSWSPQSDGRE